MQRFMNRSALHLQMAKSSEELYKTKDFYMQKGAGSKEVILAKCGLVMARSFPSGDAGVHQVGEVEL